MTTRDRIRQILLQPSASYSLSEATQLLEYSDGEMLKSIQDGDIAVDRQQDIPRLPWEEVALAATERWSQTFIEAALGSDLETVMPDLVRLTDLHVRVPRFGVLALDHIAERERTTIEAIIGRQVLDIAVSESESLERSVSGFTAALRWPIS